MIQCLSQTNSEEIQEIKKTIDKNIAKIFQQENQIEKIRKEYKECNLNAKFLTHPSKLLGYDKDHNQYWYFCTDNSKLFIKTKQTEHQPSLWFVLNKEQEILDLRNSQNTNGIREKSLCNQLDHYLTEEFFDFAKVKKPKLRQAEREKKKEIQENIQNNENGENCNKMELENVATYWIWK